MSDDPSVIDRLYKRKRLSVFISVTLGYGLFYTTRINFAVVKKPLLEAGILDATQMGLIGSALLLVYSFGKLVNGFLADRCNIARFMSTALLLLGPDQHRPGLQHALRRVPRLWALNGWVQSIGSAPSVVALSHWFGRKERGTRYGIWSASHSIGEGLTFAGTAVLVSVLGWRWGFFGPRAGVRVGGARPVPDHLTIARRRIGLPSHQRATRANRSPTPPRPSASSRWR